MIIMEKPSASGFMDMKTMSMYQSTPRRSAGAVLFSDKVVNLTERGLL